MHIKLIIFKIIFKEKYFFKLQESWGVFFKKSTVRFDRVIWKKLFLVPVEKYLPFNKICVYKGIYEYTLPIVEYYLYKGITRGCYLLDPRLKG